MIDIKLIVEKILSGDTKAFQTFVEEYKGLIGHIVFRMIKNKSDREDICQDIFIKIYQNLSEFKFESKITTWISKIAYNTCINYLEKKKFLLFNAYSNQDETPENFYPDDNITPDKFVEEKDISLHLQKVIDKMPHNLRAILTFYHIEEMSYQEISEIMNLPEGTVKSYLFRARKFLKDRLLSKYQKEEIWT
jgi:RNA polymerase sigma-70 factor (ECF subfamily)